MMTSRRARISAVVSAFVILVLAAGQTGRAQGQNPALRATDAPPMPSEITPDGLSVDNRYFVQFVRFGPDAARAVRAVGGEVMFEFPELSTIAARIPPQAVRGLQNNPNVRLVEVDPRRYLMGRRAAGATSSAGNTEPATTTAETTTQSATSEVVPYGIQMVQADQVPFGGTARKVCIIDSGYYTGHDDLPSSKATGYEAGNLPWRADGSGHGTHVAGTIHALGGNGKGVVGVEGASALDLHIVRVFGDDGSWAYSSSLVDALTRCRDANANVVSMSLGGTFSSRTERNAFDSANSAGVLSIAAAGNSGNTQLSYPASYASVVSVAAVDSAKTIASFSQQNSEVDLAAPGVGVASTVPWLDANSITAGTATYSGGHIEFSGRTVSSGLSAPLVDGGFCDATNSAAWGSKLVICQRGNNVSFFTKVTNVQSSGGVGAVIYNNVAGSFAGTLGAGNSSSIPAISLSQADGVALLSQVVQTGTLVSVFTSPGSGYEAWDGTSMATPHVSGVAALIWSHNGAWTNQQIRTALQATAEDRGTAGRDNAYGHGIIRAKAALEYLSGGGSGGGGGGGTGDTTAPVISNVAAVVTSSKNATFKITWTTDEPSTTVVTFSSPVTSTYSNTSMVTSHSASFRGTKGATYSYTVSSTDAAGYTATSSSYSITLPR